MWTVTLGRRSQTRFALGYFLSGLDSLAPARSALAGLRLRRIPFAASRVAQVSPSQSAFRTLAEEIGLAGKSFVPNEQKATDPGQEQLLLHAAVEELVRHDLALREKADGGRYLVFPSQCNRDYEDAPEPKGKQRSPSADRSRSPYPTLSRGGDHTRPECRIRRLAGFSICLNKLFSGAPPKAARRRRAAPIRTSRIWYSVSDSRAGYGLAYAEGVPGSPLKKVRAVCSPGEPADAPFAVGNLPKKWKPVQVVHLRLRNGIS